MHPMLINCETDQGNLQYEYEGVKNHLVFLLKKRNFIVRGEETSFFEVFLPDPNSDLEVVFTGLTVRGQTGWILNKHLDLTKSRNPSLSLKADEEDIHPFHFHFFPFQEIGGIVQEHVQPLPGGILENQALLNPGREAFDCPEGLSVWKGNARSIDLSNGALVGQHVMSHMHTGWVHLKVVQFYNPPKEGVFNYKVQYQDGSRLNQDILFRVQKYSFSRDAPLSAWCLLR